MNAAIRSLMLATLMLVPLSGMPAQDKTQPTKEGSKVIVVPFELLKSRHMAVEVKINGKGPYRLIFDTGAPTNLINNKLAKEAGVLKKEDKSAFPLFGMAGAKTIDTLEVGGVKLQKVPVMVMNHPTVAAISKALGPIDGIVGFPFFARFKTTIDYQKKELTFVPNGYEPGDAMQALMDKMMNASRGKQEPTMVAPAAVWGFTIDKKEGDEEAGVTVKDVLAGSPAAVGGLHAADRVLTIDGRWTDSVSDTFIAASLVKPGRAVPVVVRRDGKEVKLTIKPAKGV
jgi:hypothetical protein